MAPKIEAVVFIPFTKLFTELKTSFSGQTFDFKDSVASFRTQTSDGAIQIASDRIDLRANVLARSLDQTNKQNLTLGLSLQQTDILAQNIAIDVSVRKDLGFGWATLRLNVQCQQLKLGLSNPNPIQAKIVMNSGAAGVSQIDWDLSATSVTAELIGCNDVPGFDAELKNQVKEFLQQSFAIEAARKLVNSKLNSLLRERISAELAKLAARYAIETQNTFAFDSLNNLWVYSSGITSESFSSNEISSLGRSLKTAMLIKKSSAEEMIKMNINNYLIKNTISSKSFAGLSQITCSRFVQFFAWPALRKLSKCFDLQIKNQVESVQIENLNPLEMNVKLSSWASGEGHNLAYFATHLLVSPFANSAQVRSIFAQQDPQFTKWSGQSSRISTSLIKTPLQDLLVKTVMGLGPNEAFTLFKKNASIAGVGENSILISLD